jgi:transcriptional regulator with XRE-family HTH domain
MGRRAGVSEAERKFRKEFAAGLAAVVGSRRGAQTQVANQLGVERQLVSLYLKGETTPGQEIIRRARELWGFPSEYGGLPLGAATFPDRAGPWFQPQQLKLFSEDKQLKIIVLRRSVDSVELNVSIDFKERA